LKLNAAKEAALKYHLVPRPGKIAVIPTKPCETALDLALAYSPGVAYPCLEIAENEDLVYKYTAKQNLVAVISNGTAVLGLGDIGPSASKPVMEGKGVLFKIFADIDVFDLELDSKDADHFIEAVAALAPTFGGINLEDIKAPECFVIEEALRKRLKIPVFHDDQHGTAIISAAAFVNALEVTGKDIAQVKLVVSGAGAAAIACVKLLFSLGLKKENVLMCDSKGVIYQGRTEGMNEYKQEFANETSARTLEDALNGADAFLGLSSKDLMTPQMLLSMAANPIVFAMANPDPEIDYDLAKSTRADVIMATGRSDFPNQVNNVLGFPFIFRGALDVKATTINEEMKHAAVRALAALARETVPEMVMKAYGNTTFSFGPDYLIPKPFDSRVLYYVAPAVAKAAMDSGVARQMIDIDKYTLALKEKENKGRVVLRRFSEIAKNAKRKIIALPEGANSRVIRAAAMAADEGIAHPVLLGRREAIIEEIAKLDLDINNFEIIEPSLDSKFNDYVNGYLELRKNKGVTEQEAQRQVRLEHVFANMMLASGDADGLICGVGRYYPSVVRPILQLIGMKKGISTVAGLYILNLKDQLFFFADTTINIEMTKEKLADVAILAAEFAESMNITPRIAMLSFSNFGSVNHPLAHLVREAKELIEIQAPQYQVEGEMQVDTAIVSELMEDLYPFCKLEGPANVLVFPDMQSGNISYKLLQRLAGARTIGPIILGLNKPAYVMQRLATVDEIYNMITVAIAQSVLK
jgi:malate dehydrogenase (oxaloacetate-decarboxylating)(NADP+)